MPLLHGTNLVRVTAAATAAILMMVLAASAVAVSGMGYDVLLACRTQLNWSDFMPDKVS